ncbi:MAG TPA: hypothetical protein VN042_06035 [Asticcacaulis sp.]|nr:hypothetical protein [Asticcacaulis sp.]
MPVLTYSVCMDGKAASAPPKTKRARPRGKSRPLAVRLAETRSKYETALRKDFDALMAARKDDPDDPDIEKRLKVLALLRKAFAEAYPQAKTQDEAGMDDEADDGVGAGAGAAAVDALRLEFEHKMARYMASRSSSALAAAARCGDAETHADGVEHLGA